MEKIIHKKSIDNVAGWDRLNQFQGRPLNFLLIFPKFPPSFWGFHYIREYMGKKATMPPLGLMTIAAMCPPDWSVTIIDENVEDTPDDLFEWADLVGVSSWIVQFSDAVKIAHKAKSFGKPTMIGGPHVTGEPMAYTDEFDILILNEGEITFRQFIKDHERGDVKPVYYTNEKADLIESPIPRYDLLHHPEKYLCFGLQFSRGCPYDCEFCDVTQILGRKMRFRNVQDIIEELNAIKTLGFEGNVFITDDNFAGSKSKAIDLCETLAKWNGANGNPFTYFTQASILMAKHEDLMEAMYRARFDSVFIGIETPSKDSLRDCRKMQNVTIDLQEAVQKIHSYGMRVDGGFIVGFDNDTESIFEEQIQFIERINVSSAMVGLLSAIPSTALHDRLKKEGRLLFDQTQVGMNFAPKGTHSIGLTNIIPKNFSTETLIRGYVKLVAGIYNPKTYFNRVLRQVASLKVDDRIGRIRHLWAFYYFPLLSLMILLKFPFRREYFKAAAITVLRYPKMIREFCILALRGCHYLEFTRREVIPWGLSESDRLSKEEERKSRSIEAAGPVLAGT